MQDKYQEVLITVIASITLFLLFTTVMVMLLFQYQKKRIQHKQQMLLMQQAFTQQLLQSQIETQEETMGLLGKELHDNIGQLLSSTKMLIGVTERNLNNPPDTLIIAEDTLSKAINELRLLTKSLSKEWLQQFNFIENLSAETTRINASKKIYITFAHSNKLLIEADKQIILFRIVQEAIQNAIKHAKAYFINISIVQKAAMLELTINDNGQGFDFATVKKGLGITNIEYRTHLLGGTVHWHSNLKGTTIHILLPIKEET
jgi:signal transduction histidine kinase